MTYQAAYERVRRLSGIGSGDVATATAKSVLLDAASVVFFEIANKVPNLLFVSEESVWGAETDYLDEVDPAAAPFRILALQWRTSESNEWQPASPLSPTELDGRTTRFRSDKQTYFYSTNIFRTYLMPKPTAALYIRMFVIKPPIPASLDDDALLARTEPDGMTRRTNSALGQFEFLAVVRAAHEIRLQEGRPAEELERLMNRYEDILFKYPSVQLQTTGHIPNRNELS